MCQRMAQGSFSSLWFWESLWFFIYEGHVVSLIHLFFLPLSITFLLILDQSYPFLPFPALWRMGGRRDGRNRIVCIYLINCKCSLYIYLQWQCSVTFFIVLFLLFIFKYNWIQQEVLNLTTKKLNISCALDLCWKSNYNLKLCKN